MRSYIDPTQEARINVRNRMPPQRAVGPPSGAQKQSDPRGCTVDGGNNYIAEFKGCQGVHPTKGFIRIEPFPHLHKIKSEFKGWPWPQLVTTSEKGVLEDSCLWDPPGICGAHLPAQTSGCTNLVWSLYMHATATSMVTTTTNNTITRKAHYCLSP